jgi:hypothetical protein
MPIQIPADITIVTLRNSGRDLRQRWDDDYAGNVLQTASALLTDRADIGFRLNSLETVVEEMPQGSAADVVDESGYHFLAAVHKAGNGVRVLLVDLVSRTELGGEARYQTRVCLIAYGSDLASTSRMLAHELGHLLELPHIDDPRRSGPGQERVVAGWMRNLMYSGALNPAAELTRDQVSAARRSALAQRFATN